MEVLDHEESHLEHVLGKGDGVGGDDVGDTNVVG